MTAPSLQEFLSTPWPRWPFKEGFPLAEGATRLEVLVCLRTMDTGGYGCQRIGAGIPYGREGLTQDEHCLLQHMVGFVSGWLHATENRELDWIREAMRAERERRGVPSDASERRLW